MTGSSSKEPAGTPAVRKTPQLSKFQPENAIPKISRTKFPEQYVQYKEQISRNAKINSPIIGHLNPTHPHLSFEG